MWPTHARNGAAMEDVQAVLVIVSHQANSVRILAYRVLLLDVELKVDQSRFGSSHTKLGAIGIIVSIEFRSI